MFARFVLIATGRQCCRQIGAERGLGADEGSVESVECVGKDCDRIRAAEARECVAAPVSEVHGVERDVGSCVGWIIG
ncbi:MAG: hypothetical protein QOJ06_1101 [Pseudonocardiales bacterium]|jgi:hypothetical protein|nr:hypothetical protein [Pseudonocardiales bacterium]